MFVLEKMGCAKFSQIKGKCKAHAKTLLESVPKSMLDTDATGVAELHTQHIEHVETNDTTFGLVRGILPKLQRIEKNNNNVEIRLSPLREYARRAEPTTCSYAALFVSS
jgi:hypothetical protein